MKEAKAWTLGWFHAILAFVFLSFFLAPARIVSLRRRWERELPDQWAAVTNNGPFRSVLPYEDLGFSDEGLYAARALQVYRHGRPYGPWLGNRSLKAWIFDCLMFYPIAASIWMCGGNLSLGWLLTHAVVGCGWFSLFYLLFRVYGQDEVYALLASAFVFSFLDTLRESAMLVFYLFQEPASILSRIGYIPSTVFLPISLYMRLPEPGVVFLWLASGLGGAVALRLSSRRRAWSAVGVGVFCGLLCLVHFFDWVSCVLSLGITAVVAWCDRDLPEAGRFNITVTTAAAAAVSGAYYVFASRMTRDTMHDLIDRSGVWGRHFHAISIPFLLLSALFFWMSFRRRGARRILWMIAAALELAAFVLANLSLVLRYELMFPEHAAHFAAFAAVMAASFWVLEQERLKAYLKPRSGVLLVFFCAWSVFKAKSWADQHFKLYGLPRDVAAAVEWMNVSVPKGSAFLTLSEPITLLLPMEAEVRLPVTIGCPVCGEPISASENLRGLALTLKTLDVDPPRFKADRWRRADERMDARGVEENLTGNMNWRDMEDSLWPSFLGDVAAYHGKENEAEWDRILADLQELQPIKTQFYLWEQKGDAVFWRRSPQALGGILVYRNPSVSLYSFPNGVGGKSL